MVRVAFIINGSKKLKVQVQDILSQCNEHPEIESIQYFTKRAKEAIEISKSCTNQSFDVIVSAGGDGTMNEVLNGILDSNNEIKPVLAILPNGTGNDFIKSAKMKANTADFIESILENRTKKIDIGKIESKERTHYFLNISDTGFGGKVIEILDKQRIYFVGKMSYSIAILRGFVGFRKPILSIVTDDYQFQGEVLMIAICNGGVFGNGLIINPYAKMDDGTLNITLLGKVSLFDYIKNLRNLKKGLPIQHPEVHYLETKSIEIKLIKGKAFSEMDGEHLAVGDQLISIVKEGIRMLVY
jgi:YegS/Rv2252/BmrU family lipid kinase